MTTQGLVASLESPVELDAAPDAPSSPDCPKPSEVSDLESREHTYEPLSRLLSEASEATVLSFGSSATVVDSSSLTCGHFLGAVANLCSATLGAGILALPFAMYESGLVFGVLLLLVTVSLFLFVRTIFISTNFKVS